MTRLRWLALAVVMALVLIPSWGEATQRLGVSPHNRPDACGTCHEDGAGAAVGKPRPMAATCLSCHPDAKMHPIGMAPRDVPVPKGWPLEDGKVTCATCHAEPSCDPRRGTVGPYFRDGNPERTRDFCYRCHQRVELARSNPHEGGEKAGTCQACHFGAVPPGAAPAASKLRVGPKDACTTCHPSPVHAGVGEHVGKKVETPIAAAAAAQLPLAPDGTIACFTCHDVHAPGAETGATTDLAARIATAGGQTGMGGTALLALPVRDDQLCSACHGRGP